MNINVKQVSEVLNGLYIYDDINAKGKVIFF